MDSPADQALGIGWTGVSILIVDLSHTDPWVTGTYVIWVYRDSQDNQTQLKAQRACGLVQVSKNMSNFIQNY